MFISQSSAAVGWNAGGFNAGGFGGYVAAANIVPTDVPLICYDNQFAKPNDIVANPTASMSIDIGFAVSGSLSDNSTTNPLIVQTSGGSCQITLGFAAAAVNCFIFAGSRHELAGYRSVATRYTLTLIRADNTSIVIDSAPTSSMGSEIIQFPEIIAVKAILCLEGLPLFANIPELFLGKGLKMPYLELGFDPYNEVSYGQAFLSESGREYPQLRYRKMELSPRWSYIEKARWADLDLFREFALEIKLPFYFAWMPATRPTEVYLMRNNAKSAPMPFVNAQYRSLSLSLVEVL